MAPRSRRQRPVLTNLLVVGVWLVAGGVAAQVALETRLIVSPYEVHSDGCAFAVESPMPVPPPEPARQEPRRAHKRMPPAESLFIKTAEGDMHLHGNAVYDSSPSP